MLANRLATAAWLTTKQEKNEFDYLLTYVFTCRKKKFKFLIWKVTRTQSKDAGNIKSVFASPIQVLGGPPSLF